MNKLRPTQKMGRCPSCNGEAVILETVEGGSQVIWGSCGEVHVTHGKNHKARRVYDFTEELHS